jgi:hypothetical protein
VTRRMLSVASVLVLTGIPLLAQVVAAGRQSASPKSANRFTLADGHVSFVAPPEFTALTPAEIAAKYRRPDPTRRVVGNAGRTTTIRYEMGLEVPTTDMQEGRKALAEGYEQQLAKLKWMVNKVSRIGGREWMQFEFTASPTAVEFHNIVQVAIYNGHLLIFTCATPSTEFPSVERALRASMATITVTP